MKFFLPLLVAVIIYSCKNEKKKDDPVQESKEATIDSTLITDSSWGPIKHETDLATLKELFGSANVKDERICGPECIDSVDVTLIYPGSDKEFIVYWDDSAYHKVVGFIRCYTPGAPYHTANNIRLGTTLQELLQINGKPISFSGFGWDYGGGIVSLNQGVLEKSNVRFSLDLSENTAGDNAVYGDTELNSDMPAVKRLVDKIRVSEFFLPFNK